jgi:hypothetical protein
MLLVCYLSLTRCRCFTTGWLEQDRYPIWDWPVRRIILPAHPKRHRFDRRRPIATTTQRIFCYWAALIGVDVAEEVIHHLRHLHHLVLEDLPLGVFHDPPKISALYLPTSAITRRPI